MMNEKKTAAAMKDLQVNKLKAGDFPHGPVTLTMRDGSFFCWYDAFWLYYKEHLHVYTEHYGYHRFDGEALIWYSGPEGRKKRRKK